MSHDDCGLTRCVALRQLQSQVLCARSRVQFESWRPIALSPLQSFSDGSLKSCISCSQSRHKLTQHLSQLSRLSVACGHSFRRQTDLTTSLASFSSNRRQRIYLRDLAHCCDPLKEAEDAHREEPGQSEASCQRYGS